jgi:hypothetical protein
MSGRAVRRRLTLWMRAIASISRCSTILVFPPLCCYFPCKSALGEAAQSLRSSELAGLVGCGRLPEDGRQDTELQDGLSRGGSAASRGTVKPTSVVLDAAPTELKGLHKLPADGVCIKNRRSGPGPSHH